MVIRSLLPLLGLALALCLELPVSLQGAPPQPDEARIHRELETILSRPEFNRSRRSGDNSFLQDLIKRFWDWLNSLAGASPVVSWTLIALCLLLLGLIVWFVLWRISRILTLGARADTDEQTAARRKQLSQDFRQEALERARRGEFTEAIRFLFLSLVYHFDESGRVLFQRAYTNREYLTLFNDRPAISRDLAVFVDTLDEYWYGQHPSSAQQYDECLRLFESLNRERG